ncbi:MAG: zinc-ribbon domain-containing protein [Gemmatimonadales bacterium]|nr:zinc-ribbon domain-containing protein [Gemmatimonadales bacterium]
MITTCTHCKARYRLDGDKVPQRMIRVRCPGCSGVFHLDGKAREQELPVADPPSDFVTGFQTGASSMSYSESTAQGSAEVPPSMDAPEPAPQPITGTPLDLDTASPITTPAEPVAPVAPVAPAGLATPLDVPAASVAPVLSVPAARRRRPKEEMLARALVSDILVYNREQRDAAIAEGNLVEAMGPEIKKSWELYKEKVTPEVANTNDYFREALNDILAEGNKVF